MERYGEIFNFPEESLNKIIEHHNDFDVNTMYIIHSIYLNNNNNAIVRHLFIDNCLNYYTFYPFYPTDTFLENYENRVLNTTPVSNSKIDEIKSMDFSNYDFFVPLFIKSFMNFSLFNEKIKKENDELKSRLGELEKRMG